MTPSPVKVAALRHGIPVFQPERIRRPEAVEHLRALGARCYGGGRLRPDHSAAVIDLAPLGIINVHASLLPELRGAAPIQWSIARGYEHTGVTTMRIDAGLDTGDILDAVGYADRARRNRAGTFAPAGRSRGRLLLQTLAGLWPAPRNRSPQDNSRATLAPILKKEDGRIDWHCSAQQIHNLIRGFQPWPGAYTSFRGQSLHLWRSRLVPQRWNLAPGALVRERWRFRRRRRRRRSGITGSSTRRPKNMPAEVFANGHRLTETGLAHR